MKALSAVLIVVGLVACGGASRPAASTQPARPAGPTRVDHARTPMNAKYASGSPRVLADAYATAFASARYTTPPAYAQAFAQTCHSSADCGTGDFACRAREDGVRVCMGYGSRGESCWFGADCVSGTCELSDGHKVCR